MNSKNEDRFQVPLMFAFREAYKAKDSRKASNEKIEGVRVINNRGNLHRRGLDEASLRASLVTDLDSLFNSINLHSAESLDAYPYVKKSIVNFGLEDISFYASEGESVEALADALRQNLLNFEPRLRPETLEVVQTNRFDDVEQRIRLSIRGDIICRPLDVPIDFVVEVETGSGKVKFSKLSETS
nr:type VI secretion system baseplate subunit TssE [uncultured Cohaesibacter sp.]